MLDFRSSGLEPDWLLRLRGVPAFEEDGEEDSWRLEVFSSCGEVLKASGADTEPFGRALISAESFPPDERLRDSFGLADDDT